VDLADERPHATAGRRLDDLDELVAGRLLDAEQVACTCSMF